MIWQCRWLSTDALLFFLYFIFCFFFCSLAAQEAAPEEVAPEKNAPEEAAPEEAAPEAADAADPTSELKQILSSVASTGIPPVLTKDMIEKLLAAAAAAAAAAAEASASASASASAAPPVHEGRSSGGRRSIFVSLFLFVCVCVNRAFVGSNGFLTDSIFII